MGSQKSLGMEMRSLNILIIRKIAEMTGMTADDQSITFMQGRIIEFLHMNQGKDVFQRDIEHSFGIRRPTATKILQSMERRGLISRQGVDYDARLKLVILTEKSMKLLAKMNEVFDRFESELIKGLTDDELEMLFKIMEKIKRNIGSPQTVLVP